MTTLVFIVPDLTEYRVGVKAYIIDKFKIQPELGQRLLLQTPTEELQATVSAVEVLERINKAYTVVSFRVAVEPVLNLQTGNLE